MFALSEYRVQEGTCHVRYAMFLHFVYIYKDRKKIFKVSSMDFTHIWLLFLGLLNTLPWYDTTLLTSNSPQNNCIMFGAENEALFSC